MIAISQGSSQLKPGTSTFLKQTCHVISSGNTQQVQSPALPFPEQGSQTLSSSHRSSQRALGSWSRPCTRHCGQPHIWVSIGQAGHNDQLLVSIAELAGFLVEDGTVISNESSEFQWLVRLHIKYNLVKILSSISSMSSTMSKGKSFLQGMG